MHIKEATTTPHHYMHMDARGVYQNKVYICKSSSIFYGKPQPTGLKIPSDMHTACEGLDAVMSTRGKTGVVYYILVPADLAKKIFLWHTLLRVRSY